MELFKAQIMGKDAAIVFGCTWLGLTICRYIKSEFEDLPVCFCDNAAGKHGVYNDIPVYSVEEAVRKYPRGLFIITSSLWRQQECRQLQSLNVTEDRITCHIPMALLDESNRTETAARKRKLSRSAFHFEVNIVKHCNLNCKGCDHFSPLVKSGFMPVEVFRRDMERMAELFEGEAEKIYLLGGEPLLHPNLIDFMEIGRKNFSRAKIAVITNGILLPKMKTVFWEACKKNAIEILPTRYPIAIDYEKMGEVARSYGVEYAIFGDTQDNAKMLWYEPLDLSGSHNPADQFAICRQANFCITLDHGRIYTCVVVPGVSAFNDYFQMNLEITEADSIDIYKAKSADEILDFLWRPIPFCKYCAWEKHTQGNPWERSKRDIREWSL